MPVSANELYCLDTILYMMVLFNPDFILHSYFFYNLLAFFVAIASVQPLCQALGALFNKNSTVVFQSQAVKQIFQVFIGKLRHFIITVQSWHFFFYNCINCYELTGKFIAIKYCWTKAIDTALHLKSSKWFSTVDVTNSFITYKHINFLSCKISCPDSIHNSRLTFSTCHWKKRHFKAQFSDLLGLKWCLLVASFFFLYIFYILILTHLLQLLIILITFIKVPKLRNCEQGCPFHFYTTQNVCVCFIFSKIPSFGPSEVLGCYYSRVALCELYCTTGSSLLQINELPVCGLEKMPQALACHWLLACLT